MDDYTEHIDGLLARIEAEARSIPLAINVTANDPEELVVALQEWARHHKGLQ